MTETIEKAPLVFGNEGSKRKEGDESEVRRRGESAYDCYKQWARKLFIKQYKE